MNAKMKVLSLALVGMFGYVGGAIAACPAGPAVADGGAWTSKAVTLGTMAIVTPGEAGSECRLATALNQNSALIAKSQVRDDTPNAETRYRARFYIDTTEVTGLTALRSVQVYVLNGTSAPSGAGQSLLRANLFKLGTVANLRLTLADTSQAGNIRTVDVPLAVESGKNRFEFDLGTGSAAQFRYWMSTAAAATSDASPTGTITGINNQGWGGADSTLLGLGGASNGYRQAYGASNHIYFDQFDSRRQTFIGQ